MFLAIGSNHNPNQVLKTPFSRTWTVKGNPNNQLATTSGRKKYQITFTKGYNQGKFSLKNISLLKDSTVSSVFKTIVKPQAIKATCIGVVHMHR